LDLFSSPQSAGPDPCPFGSHPTMAPFVVLSTGSRSHLVLPLVAGLDWVFSPRFLSNDPDEVFSPRPLVFFWGFFLAAEEVFLPTILRYFLPPFLFAHHGSLLDYLKKIPHSRDYVSNTFSRPQDGYFLFVFSSSWINARVEGEVPDQSQPCDRLIDRLEPRFSLRALPSRVPYFRFWAFFLRYSRTNFFLSGHSL